MKNYVTNLRNTAHIMVGWYRRSRAYRYKFFHAMAAVIIIGNLFHSSNTILFVSLLLLPLGFLIDFVICNDKPEFRKDLQWPLSRKSRRLQNAALAIALLYTGFMLFAIEVTPNMIETWIVISEPLIRYLAILIPVFEKYLIWSQENNLHLNAAVAMNAYGIVLITSVIFFLLSFFNIGEDAEVFRDRVEIAKSGKIVWIIFLLIVVSLMLAYVVYLLFLAGILVLSEKTATPPIFLLVLLGATIVPFLFTMLYMTVLSFMGLIKLRYDQ